ncbi:hypothetical protein KW803_03230 [Candidatus Saccharibacteria bacterium]|nr:hypothetical protein [Candidatus Saccharibacteria bacterium]
MDFILLLILVFGVLLTPRTQAGSISGSSYSSSSVSCVNNASSSDSARPSPYTGGANLARVYYPQDGSTVTVTTTGAVIKQSPCATPYRQGWVNPADINCLNSYSDLSGQMSSGSNNPYSNSVYNPNGSCSSSCTNCSNSLPASNVTYSYSNANTYTTPPQPAAQTVMYPVASNTSTSKGGEIPNTGPGNVLALGLVSTFLGTIGHFFYKRYRMLNT